MLNSRSLSPNSRLARYNKYALDVISMLPMFELKVPLQRSCGV